MLPALFLELCVIAIGATASAIEPVLEFRAIEPVLEPRAPVHVHDFDLHFSANNLSLPAVAIEGVIVSLQCITCETFGTASVTTTGIIRDATFDQTAQANVDTGTQSFDAGEDLTTLLGNHLNATVDVVFHNTSALFHFTLLEKFAKSHVFTLLSYPVAGFALGKDSIGLTLVMELIVTLSTPVQFETVFEYHQPDGARINIDPIHLTATATGFSGTNLVHKTNITDPGITLTAQLRVTLLVGIKVNALGIIHLDYKAGEYMDLPTYKVTGNATRSNDSISFCYSEAMMIDYGYFLPANLGITVAQKAALAPAPFVIERYELPSGCT